MRALQLLPFLAEAHVKDSEKQAPTRAVAVHTRHSVGATVRALLAASSTICIEVSNRRAWAGRASFLFRVVSLIFVIFWAVFRSAIAGTFHYHWRFEGACASEAAEGDREGIVYFGNGMIGNPEHTEELKARDERSE